MLSGSRLKLRLLLALLCSLTIRAYSADLTLYVGGMKPGKLTVNNVRTALDGSPIIGLRAGFDFVPLLGMEHTLGFSSDFLFPRSLSSVTRAKGFVYNSNFILNLPLGHVVPYGTAGLGLIRQYGSADLPLGTHFAANYGGGLKLARLAGPFGLRFDARGYSIFTGITGRLNVFEATGGLLISFGR